MNPIDKTFESLRRKNKKALIPFVMGGDPDMVTTQRILVAMQNAGADILEIGMPFSDPLADGPTIQLATSRALAAGMTPKKWLKGIAGIKDELAVPLVCLTYWNPILQFKSGRFAGPEAFFESAAAAGLSGLVIPDLSLEASDKIRPIAERYGIHLILLAAPTSSSTRMRAIAEASEGFIYYVSVTGTTGERRSLSPKLKENIRELRLVTPKPVCVGFGISSAKTAKQVAEFADGVIIGSALIKELQSVGSRKEKVRAAGRFVRRFRSQV